MAGGTKTGFSFTQLETQYYPEWSHRPKTAMVPLKMSFVCLNGGMGDYLCWHQPIRWLAECATWIEGTVVIPTYMKELTAYWLKPYPKWKFVDYIDTQHIPEIQSMPYRGPMDLGRESLNATGAHLLTCGWTYFCNKESAPDAYDSKGRHWDNYPPLYQEDLDKVELPNEARHLFPKKYAIVTTGITTESRRVPAGGWNPIIEYIREKGLTPVFLGKEEIVTGNAKNIHTMFDDKINYSLGVDLRNKTSMMQAASIMSKAKFVLGHDNGLLHLAGCTDVPIIFGYNLASPKHREPRRPIGKIYNVHLTREELACNFCQSAFNFVVGYNFRRCYYADNQCMTLLFNNGGERWKKAINDVLRDESVIEKANQ